MGTTLVPLTTTQVNMLNNSSPAAKATSLGSRLREAGGGGGTAQSHGRLATGHVRVGTNAQDGDTVTVTVGPVTIEGMSYPPSSVVYEFDNNAAVTAGRILVTIGGTAALSATALAAAIAANQGAALTAAAHATNTTVVDIASRAPGAAFTLATASGGRLIVQDNADELLQQALVLWGIRRTVTAEDVARTRIVLNTGLVTVISYSIRLALSAADSTPVAYNGTITATGGVIELTLGTAGGVFAAGNILDATVYGT
jgi:hypothetical protein